MDARSSIVDTVQDSCSALHIACEYPILKVVSLLVEGGQPLEEIDNQNRTALAIACAYGARDIAELLLNAGANPNTFEKVGRTRSTLLILICRMARMRCSQLARRGRSSLFGF